MVVSLQDYLVTHTTEDSERMTANVTVIGCNTESKV